MRYIIFFFFNPCKRVGVDAGWQAQPWRGCFSERMFAVPTASSHHVLAGTMFSEVYPEEMQLGHGNRPDSPFAYIRQNMGLRTTK